MFDLNAIVSAAIATAVDARITELMQQHANIVGALAERIEKLENNPAIGVDTTLEQRIAALEVRVDNNVEASEARIRVIAEAAAEQALDEHYSSYDHDSYDSHRDDDDIHIEGDLEDAVTDAVRNLTFEVTVS